MMTLGRKRSTWGSSRLPRGSVIVQLRAAFPPGRWAAMHMPSGPESGHFPSICLFLCNQTRHHLSRVLREKHDQPVINFTASLCQCILNYMVGAFIPLLLYSEKKRYTTDSVDFVDGSVVKNPLANAGDMGSVPELGRYSGEEKGYPLQYSCLENPMDRGAWKAIIHVVTKSRTPLSD